MKIIRLAPWVLAASVMIGVLLPVTFASASAPAAAWIDSPVLAMTEPDVRVYVIGGNVRPNSPNASAGWHIIDDANHDAPGLTGVTCLSNGILRVSYPPTVRVGVLQANPDEEWTGKFQAGGSQGFSHTDFRITSRSGSKVPCNSASLTSAGNWTMLGFMLY